MGGSVSDGKAEGLDRGSELLLVVTQEVAVSDTKLLLALSSIKNHSGLTLLFISLLLLSLHKRAHSIKSLNKASPIFL